MQRKVAIITFFTNYNYGSYLQAYALSRKIEDVGYEPCLLDYSSYGYAVNRKFRIITLKNKLLCCLRHPNAYKTLKAVYSNTHHLIHDRSADIRKVYDDFSNQYLPVYPGDYSGERFYAGVVGSDQVWKVNIPGLNAAFFLRTDVVSKRIAYAASLGGDEIPGFNKNRLRRYLKDFHAVSVREDTAVKALQTFGCRAEFVLDPVLLAGREFWIEAVSGMASGECETDGRYILCYFLDDCDELTSAIERFAEQQNCRVLWVKSEQAAPAKWFVSINPTPFEFVKLLSSAAYVLTDSFHGTAFSIMMNRNFCTYPRKYQLLPGQRNRIESLLRTFGLEEHFLNLDDVHELSHEQFRVASYDKINERIKELQEKSRKYLEEALSDESC